MVASDLNNENKKRRVESTNGKLTVARSHIYQPFRAIGYVTNDVPFVVETRGQDHFLTTCVGYNFQIYNLEKMNLLFVGSRTDRAITAMTVGNNVTYTACGNTIIGSKRGKEISRVGGEGSFTIFQLLVLGSYIAGLCDDNSLRMWDVSSGEMYTEIEFDAGFTASAMIHPSTYLNKILISSTQGTMQIWNIRTNKMIYQFKSFGSPITCLTQSPVVDVVAVGTLEGSVILYNIKMDEKIDSVRQNDRVTAISFRTDEEQVMATASMHGDVALWDLQNRRLLHIMRGAHDGLISSIAFLSGQPVLVTAGADNAVKQWKFEKDNAVPHAFKQRSGHHAPPTKIRYYDENGRFILSAGRDQTLRAFSVYRDAQSFELSQGHLAKKAKSKDLRMDELRLPLITDFDAGRSKEKEWDNVLTAHLNDNGGRTWTMKNKSIGKHTLLSTDKSAVKVTAISACGNYGFLGCASGQIDMYNMQSGLHRKTFGGPDGHKKAISGLASDYTNRYLVSASIDRTIKIWDFKSAKVLHTIEMESPIASIQYHRDNDLVAVVCDDLGIRVVDIETQKIVREFWGHRNRITDMTFTPDGRWIVSASLDSTVRTWDLSSSMMVDIFKVEDIVTSLSFSPKGDFLATSHMDNVGIFLWANRTQFANIALRSIVDDEEVELLALPSLGGLDEVQVDDEEEEEAIVVSDNLATAEQLADEMITLSLEPRAKWQNLLNLDTIKQRNKPTEAPKVPEKAPFFLPTLPGAAPRFAIQEEKQETATESHRVQFSELNTETEFTRFLRQGHEQSDYSEFITYVKTLNPSAIDLEMRTMPIDGDLTQLNYFMEAIAYMLRTRKNFELAQAWLNVFLMIHGDLIVANPSNPIHDKLNDILQVQKEEFGRLSEHIHYGLCLIDFARKA
ncbi:Utp21 specific WD40 associated putative domain-containing protein [Radiomyces spectabilis]|uniref:Utp21 specific WD40 associated putative domain-containing protein n=1 Tax=Radiomyces spectabilis TaxID=64574 RepID=UPI0022200491|nr:Utp21 specific WD40 associated putative domain-containing protein [Radiomyces spectabilis]KAI8379183.1 Utp21 specific WD40 associated putative domain-containing protein [Radiomyces spectabilis]